jgi:hypothetical protein
MTPSREGARQFMKESKRIEEQVKKEHEAIFG